ncbi:MAG TPA: ATP-dependent metallopeptidase FtsH/Yme1/Tma family protein, partial [Gammaproteobacteria bacterium]|nr:ATP-dependent metallopeptidase FtsH/Yme1/Tma family protein [Gammaproteobacteria bacterium]
MAQQKPTQPPEAMSRSLSPMTIGLWLLMLIALGFMLFSSFGGSAGREISYDRFLSLVRADKVQAVVLQGHAVHGKLKAKQPVGGEKNGKEAQPFQQFSTRVPSFGADNVVALLERHHVKLDVAARQNGGWVAALVSMLPWLLFIGFMVWIVRGASKAFQSGAGSQINQLTQFMRRSVKKAERPQVTFADVAGQDAAKQEVSELVGF